jgi:hypothetical protein
MSAVVPFEAVQRRQMYKQHLKNLFEVKPTVNSRSTRGLPAHQPWKIDYNKVLSQRKILRDEISDGKRMRDMYRKRREEFEKRFSAAVGYKSPGTEAFARKAIQQERKILAENAVIMGKLKRIRDSNVGVKSEDRNSSRSSKISSGGRSFASYRPTNPQNSAYYDMTGYRSDFVEYMLTKVDVPKGIPVSKMDNEFMRWRSTRSKTVGLAKTNYSTPLVARPNNLQRRIQEQLQAKRSASLSKAQVAATPLRLINSSRKSSMAQGVKSNASPPRQGYMFPAPRPKFQQKQPKTDTSFRSSKRVERYL